MSQQKYLRFVWKFVDVPYCPEREIFSPTFESDFFVNASYNLVLYPRPNKSDQVQVSFITNSSKTRGKKLLPMKYEVAFITSDGGLFKLLKGQYAEVEGGYYRLEHWLRVTRKEFVGRREIIGKKERKDRGFMLLMKDKLFVDDTLTVQCRIDMSHVYFPQDVTIYATTRASVARSSFNWVLQGVGFHKRVIPLRYEFGPLKTPWLEFKLSPKLAFAAKVKIIKECDREMLVSHRMFFVDGDGNSVAFSTGEHFCSRDDPCVEWGIPILPDVDLIVKQNKESLFPNNELSLKCEFVFSDGIRFQSVGEPVHGECTLEQNSSPSEMESSSESSGESAATSPGGF